MTFYTVSNSLWQIIVFVHHLLICILVLVEPQVRQLFQNVEYVFRNRIVPKGQILTSLSVQISISALVMLKLAAFNV